MANGAQCCAIGVCCNDAQKRARLVKVISAYTGNSDQYCERFLDWMHHEGLTFAPDSMQLVIDDIAAITRKHPRDESA